MSDLVLAGGTVVTAEGSFRADVAVTGETIEAIGVDVPRDGANVVDVSGARVMPGFIDGHTHMDMPFGGTVTADDWDTGTAAALAGRDHDDRRLLAPGPGEHAGQRGRDMAWQGGRQGAHRLRLPRRDHQPDRGRQAGDPVAARRSACRRSRSSWPTRERRSTRRISTCSRRCRSRARPACWCSCTPRTATSSPACRRRRWRPGTRSRGLPRAHAPGGGRGGGDRTARSASPRSRTRRCWSCTSRARRRWRRCVARTRAGARCTPRPARSTSSSPTTSSPRTALRARSTCSPRRCASRATSRRCGTGCRRRTCTSSAPTTARSTTRARRSWV